MLPPQGHNTGRHGCAYPCRYAARTRVEGQAETQIAARNVVVNRIAGCRCGGGGGMTAVIIYIMLVIIAFLLCVIISMLDKIIKSQSANTQTTEGELNEQR